ncbi:MAG: hypothetical protein VKJ24_15145 [Synechococcales bacterium]|nr:hypothetical protein [Synechococcales bacterium]
MKWSEVKWSKVRSPLYLGLTLAFAILYGIMALFKAFRAEFVVQDDARFYLYWMARLTDPTAMPQDFIADYAQAVTPQGFTLLYRWAAHGGVDPLLFSKCLPFLLGILSALEMYYLAIAIVPIPLTAFLSSLILNQSLWFRDDLASATPRAFIYPCLLFLLYGLVKSRFWMMGLAIALQSFLYPPFTLVCLCLLAVHLWQQWRSHALTQELGQRSIGVMAIGIATFLPYLFASGSFAPVVSLAEGVKMLEFGSQGRLAYFMGSPWQFILFGEHSGLIPGMMPPLIWISLLLPVVWKSAHLKFQTAKPLLLNLLLTSVGLWGLAHGVWLRLYFPSRYVNHTFRIAAAIASAIVLTLLIDKSWQLWRDRSQCDRSRNAKLGCIISSVLLLLLVGYPHFSDFPRTNYRISTESGLFQTLRNVPNDRLVATLSEVANSIPVFAQRSVFFSREMANPYHLGYYRPLRQRIADALIAQYSPNFQDFATVVQRYGIDYWLVERNGWQPSYLQDKSKRWLSSIEPEYSKSLMQGRSSWLSQQEHSCQLWQDDRLTLLDTSCLLKQSAP